LLASVTKRKAGFRGQEALRPGGGNLPNPHRLRLSD
jgi:hypothetical protein